MNELRELITQALVDAGVYIDDSRFDRIRRQAAAAGARHLWGDLHRACGLDARAVAGEVGLSTGAITRVFGHGWQQAAGLAAMAGVRPHRQAEVARLGALLNLGIVLFDHIADTAPDRRPALAAALDPERLLTHSPVTFAAARGEPGLRPLVGIAAEVIAGARRIGGRPADVRSFEQTMVAMYRGEMGGLAPRSREPPTDRIWEALRAKSALPAVAGATFALLANPPASDAVRSVVLRAGALTGEAFWIVDDLADVVADWEAGAWSRPLWLLLHRERESPANGADATRRVLASGIASAEAQRLARVLAGLAALPGAPHSALAWPVQAAVRSWIEDIQPLDQRHNHPS